MKNKVRPAGENSQEKKQGENGNSAVVKLYKLCQMPYSANLFAKTR